MDQMLSLFTSALQAVLPKKASGTTDIPNNICPKAHSLALQLRNLWGARKRLVKNLLTI